MTHIELHELCRILPPMSGDDYKALRESMIDNGLIESILLYEGLILDGRHRYQLCQNLGIEPHFVEFTGTYEEAARLVIAKNVARRHLTSSQKAVLALELEPMLAARAKERQRAAAQATNEKLGRDTLPQTIAEATEGTGEAREQAAEMTGTNRQYVSDAKRIAEQAPELLDKVRAGEMSIPEAKRIAAGNYRTVTTGENEWYTPAQFIEMARAVMGGIDLDPASCAEANETVGATQYFDEDQDGLTQRWLGRVWLNPPYSRDLMPRFTDKLNGALISGDVSEAIMVSHNNTDTAWFHKLAPLCTAICFPVGRIRFYRGEDVAAPVNGQMFMYFGANAIRFQQVFSSIGFVVVPA